MSDRDQLAKAIHDVQCHAWLSGQRQFCKEHPNAGHFAAADAGLAWMATRQPAHNVDDTAAAQRAIARAFTYHPDNRSGTPESREPMSLNLAGTALKALLDAGYTITQSGAVPNA